MFPHAHGAALAAEIPDTTLLSMPDAGHEPPPARLWDTVVPTLLEHTQA